MDEHAWLSKSAVIGVAMIWCCGGVGHADFNVAFTSSRETSPVVALNTQTGNFLVAYLDDSSGTPELRAMLFNPQGQPQGSELAPLGTLSHEAIGRPALAYSPASNQFFIAVPERLSSSDRVLGRPLDGSGNSLCCPEFMFDDGTSQYYPGNLGDGVGALQVVHNSLLDEFVVTMQRVFWNSDCATSSPCNNSVWAQRVGSAGQIGDPILLVNFGLNGFHEHALGYAPVAGTSPLGGRYLFASGDADLRLLDATLDPILTLWNQGSPTMAVVPLNYGAPEGNYDDLDIAFGEVEGEQRFLVVWSDSDNCRPPLASCTDMMNQWTGIWGTYVDPAKTMYPETAGDQGNTPFPISKIYSHLGNKTMSTPRVTFSTLDNTFAVVWREIPFESSLNDESRSHIRGAFIDSFVPDGLYGTSLVPLPERNYVVSDVTGSCTSGTPCYSEEDPLFPDVAPLNHRSQVAVVWQQQFPPQPTDLDVFGDVLDMCLFCDDFESGDTSRWSAVVP